MANPELFVAGPIPAPTPFAGTSTTRLLLDAGFVPSTVQRLGDIDGDLIEDFAIGGQFLTAVGTMPLTFAPTSHQVVLVYGDLSRDLAAEIDVTTAALDLAAADPADIGGAVFAIPGGSVDTDAVTIEPLGDINGDDLDDFFLRRDGADAETVSAVVFGNADRSVLAGFGAFDPAGAAPFAAGEGLILDLSDGSAFGEPKLVGLGDVNADGFDDVAVLLPGNGTDIAEARVLFGSATIDDSLTLDLGDPFASAAEGFEIGIPTPVFPETAPVPARLNAARLGDVNGDGLDDFAILFPDVRTGTGGGGTFGVIRIIDGRDPTSGDDPFPAVFDGGLELLSNGSAFLGTSIDGGGDFDGNAFADFFILSGDEADGRQEALLVRGDDPLPASPPPLNQIERLTFPQDPDDRRPAYTDAVSIDPKTATSPSDTRAADLGIDGDFDGDGLSDAFVAKGDGDTVAFSEDGTFTNLVNGEAGLTLSFGDAEDPGTRTTVYDSDGRLDGDQAQNAGDGRVFLRQDADAPGFLGDEASYVGNQGGGVGDEILVLAPGVVSGLDGSIAESAVYILSYDPVVPAPVLADDMADIASGGVIAALDILGNDPVLPAPFGSSDFSLELSATETAELGTASLNPDGTLRYEANAGVSGADDFDYVVTTPGGSTSATITINVVPGIGGDAIVVDTFEDVVDAGDGLTSLREAIAAANMAGSGTIQLGAGTHILEDQNAGDDDLDPPVAITGDVTIRGAGPGSTQISYQQVAREGGSRVGMEGLFAVDDAAELTLSGLEIVGLREPVSNDTQVTDFSAITNRGTLVIQLATIRDVVLDDRSFFSGVRTSQANKSAPVATVSASESTSLDFTAIEGASNSATLSKQWDPTRGAAIHNIGGVVTVEDSTFAGNKATEGGAIFTDGGSVSILDSAFLDNLAVGNFVDASTETAKNGQFLPSAPESVSPKVSMSTTESLDRGTGAAIYNEGGVVEISGESSFAGNRMVASSTARTSSLSYLDEEPSDADDAVIFSDDPGTLTIGPDVEILPSNDPDAVIDLPIPPAAMALTATLQATAEERAIAASAARGPATLEIGPGYSLASLTEALTLYGVENGIVSASATEIVIDSFGAQTIFRGTGFVLPPMPNDVILAATTLAELQAAFDGTVTEIELVAEGSGTTLAHLTGIMEPLDALIASIFATLADADPFSVTDLLGDIPLSITATADADTLAGALGDDHMAAGAGDDFYVVRPGAGDDGITERAGEGFDTVLFEGIGLAQASRVVTAEAEVIGFAASLGGGSVSLTRDGLGNTNIERLLFEAPGGGFVEVALADIPPPGSAAPRAFPDMLTVSEDGPPVVVDLAERALDPNGDPVSVVELGLLGTEGMASAGPGGTEITYDPAGAFEALGLGETAIDRLLFTVGDGSGETATARLDVTVLGENDPPVANPDFGAVEADRGEVLLFLTPNDTDPDANDDLEVVAVETAGTLGSVAIQVSGEGVVYDPGDAFGFLAPGETAEDVFSYTVADGNGGTDVATVTVTVTGTFGSTDENTPPVTLDDAATVPETGSPVFIDLLANDTDVNGDPLAVASLAPVGAVSGLFALQPGGRLRYDAEGRFPDLFAGETAEEVFAYTVSDGRGGTDGATVTVTVSGAGAPPAPGDPADPERGDLPPVARDDALAAVSGAGPLAADLFADNGFGEDRDPEGFAIAVAEVAGAAIGPGPTPVTLPSGALLTLGPDGEASYDPGTAFGLLAPGETAADVFAYRIADPGGRTDQATVTVTVAGAPYDEVDGTEGDDLFTLDDFATATAFDGGAGQDTVALPGAAADYLICPDGDGIVIEPVDGAGMRTGQPVRLTGIERIELGGGEVLVLDESPEAAAIYDAFQVFLGRKGQPAGIDFYADLLEAGLALDAVSAAFPDSMEFVEANGAPGDALDPEAFVTIVFENGLGRQPASSFWSDLIAEGVLTPAEVGLAVAASEEYEDRFGDLTASGVFRLEDGTL